MNQDFEEKQPKQPGFFWLFEWSENAEKFNDHQLAEFVRAMVSAAKGEEYTINDDPLVELAFKYANRDRERMDYQRVTKSINGSKGGAPRGNKNASKQPKTTEKQPKTTENKLKDKDKDKYKDKDIVNNNPLTGVSTPARVGMEFFGIMKNVQLSAQQHRTLVETYGEEIVNSTIDDLSCKLADGRSDSLNHYATLYQWLNRSHQSTPILQHTQPSSMQLTENEKRQIWARLSDKDKQEYLDTHDGLTPWQYEEQHGTN